MSNFSRLLACLKSGSLRWPALILLLGSALHFALGFVLGLSGDEAHYALYATHPALSYYDHPPLVGWIQWPLVALNAPDGLLRLIPELLWALCGVGVYAVARELHELLSALTIAEDAARTDTHTDSPAAANAAGLWALIAFALSPVLHILGIGLLPDTLLMTLTIAVLGQTLRMLAAARAQSLKEWLLLGALLGLAGLSKYTAIFLALPVLAALLLAHGVRLLLRPAPWVALLLALALVAPVFIWNAQHDWISFAYQLHHSKGSQWQFSQVGVFALAQVLLYPLLAWGALGLLRARAAGAQAVGSAGAPGGSKCVGLPLAQLAALISFFALPFGVLMYLSGGGSGLPHWTAPAWVALAPFAGVGLAWLWRSSKRLVLWLLLVLQAALCLAMFALLLSAGPTSLASSEQPEVINPLSDFYGWREVGQQAAALAQQTGVQRLAVQNWTLASRLAWYARPLPVHVLASGFDQFSLWSGELPLGASAVLLDWSQMAYKLPVGTGQFESCERAQQLPVERAGRVVSRFTLYVCSNWGGQPRARRWDEL